MTDTKEPWIDRFVREYCSSQTAENAVRAAYAELQRQGQIRTPGTVEVCENQVYEQCRNHHGGMRFESCKVKPCPLKGSP